MWKKRELLTDRRIEQDQFLSPPESKLQSRTLKGYMYLQERKAPTHGKTRRLRCIVPEAFTQQAADEYRTAGLARRRELSALFGPFLAQIK